MSRRKTNPYPSASRQKWSMLHSLPTTLYNNSTGSARTSTLSSITPPLSSIALDRLSEHRILVPRHTMTCSSSHSSSGRITSLKQQQYQSDFGSSGCEKNHLSLSQPSSIGVSPHAISESRLTSGTYERDIAVPGRVASSISGSDGSYRISGTRRNVAASSPSTGHGRSKCDASCFGSSSSDSSHDLSSSKHLKSANKYFGENGSDISLSDVAPLSEPVAAPRRCEVDFLSLDSVLSTKDLQGDVLESHFISGTHERDFSSMSHVESSRLITDATYGSSGTIKNAAPSFAPNRGRHVTSSLSNVTDSSSVKHVHSGRKPLEENRLEMNSQGVFFNSATDVQPELYHINQVSIELFGCCELTMSLSPVIWEYIEKYHDRELRDIKKYCQLDVLKKPDGELSMMVKTSSYRKFICKFEDVFKPLYEQLNLEIIEVKCDMIRRQDKMKIKDQLEDFKCVVHMYGGGHLRIICQISDKEVVEGIVQHFAEGSVKNDQIGSLPLPARGFAPTGYIVNNSIEIFIHINDITSLDVDAITNPSNPWLEALGGLSGVIAGKAGFDFEDECCGIMAKRGRELNVGEVVHTGGGKLQAPFVIHVTGPIWPTNPTQDNMLGCLFVLIEVFQNIISYADDRGFKTIAIPPISSGVYGVPCDVVAMAAHKIMGVISRLRHLKEIHFVDISDEFLMQLQDYFKEDIKSGKVAEMSLDRVVSRMMSITQSISGSALNTNRTVRNTLAMPSLASSKEKDEQIQVDSYRLTSSHKSPTGTGFGRKCFLVNGSVRVILQKSDISEMKVNAIVNPTNSKLKQAHGVGGSLVKKAGSGYIADCQKIIEQSGTLDMSVVLETCAGNLPCDMVLQAVTPRWSNDKRKQKDCLSDLARTLYNVLRTAEELKLHSIAWPVIGGGVAGIPYPVTGYKMLDALINGINPLLDLKVVYIVDICDEILEVIYRVFQSNQVKGHFEEVADRQMLVKSEMLFSTENSPSHQSRGNSASPRHNTEHALNDPDVLNGQRLSWVRSPASEKFDHSERFTSGSQSAITGHSGNMSNDNRHELSLIDSGSVHRSKNVPSSNKYNDRHQNKEMQASAKSKDLFKDKKELPELVSERTKCVQDKYILPPESVNQSAASVSVPIISQTLMDDLYGSDGISDIQSSSNAAMNGELDHTVDHQSASACDTMTETGFSIKYFLVNGSVTVILDKDDITQMKVDAIVNPTNSKLKGIKSVGTLLEEKAGPDYIADCKRCKDAVGGFQIGDVQETCAGKLPCKFVLQAVIPRWTKDESKQKEYAGDLETTFYNVFKKAKQLKLDSVACPVLSAGTSGIPCPIMARTVCNALLNTVNHGYHLKEIHIVDLRDDNLDTVYNVFVSHQVKGYIEELTDCPSQAAHMKAMSSENHMSKPDSVGGHDPGNKSQTFLGQRESPVTSDIPESCHGNGGEMLQAHSAVKGNSDDSKQEPDLDLATSTNMSVSRTSNCGDLKHSHKSRSEKRQSPEGSRDVCPKEISQSSGKRRDVPQNKKTLNSEERRISLARESALASEEAIHLKEQYGNIQETSSSVIPNGKHPKDLLKKSESVQITTECLTSGAQGHGELKNESLASEHEEEGIKREQVMASKVYKQEETVMRPENYKCVICLQCMVNPETLPCKHTFCENCIRHLFSKYQPKCPCCGVLYGQCKGDQPEGSMKTCKLDSSLPGFEGYKTIQITYEFPNGTQGPDHPNPGCPYYGTRRTAYLPDNDEGREVLKLLTEAFNASLVFTIGQSVTTGADDVIVWNNIHHKTSRQGGPTRYGYPDPTYLARVRLELADKGIK